MKTKAIILICTLCLLFSLSAVNANDVVSNDTAFSNNNIEDSDYLNGIEVLNDNTETDSSETVNKTNCECCSFIIQETNETVFAFRQDSPLNGYGLEINTQSWHGLNIIKQEIDTTSTYFFHGIITENGWVMGQGGSQYNSASRSIEEIAATMVVNNDISSTYLNQIKNILSSYGYGHFVIKAPDGRYGIAFSNTYLTGYLEAGQYLVVPNYYSSYYKGNYKDYASNPVDAIIIICSYEDTGENRRDLMTYDYKIHETSNGLFYGVDIYATNDNGHNVGLNTASIVTHFYYNGKYYAPSVIPQNPDKLYVATEIFENQPVGSAIELIEGANYAVVNNEMEVHYEIKHISSDKTVIFNLGDNVEFIKATINYGTYNYDSQQHTLYWQIPSVSETKDITITLKPEIRGNYNLHTYI